MKTALLLLLTLPAATPALAQHAGHAAPDGVAKETPDPHAGHSMPTPPPTAAPDPHAGHAMLPTPSTAPAPADPHAGHNMSGETSEKAPDPHAGHQMSPPATPAQADPHAGHGVNPAPAQGDPHRGHVMPALSVAPPVAQPPPQALSGPAHAADTVFSPDAMTRARENLRREHGGLNTYRFTIDRLELVSRRGRDGYAWEDVQFWYGGDLNKLWIKSEGEGTFGRKIERAEIQVLWSRAIAPFFDFQAGVRYDIRPRPNRAHLAAGLQGLLPYGIELDAAAFLSDAGDLTARIEGEYDLRITQRLVLQPRAEIEFAAQDVPEPGIGSGISKGEAGVRLRYEIRPEFAPYVGVQYERAFGDTARFRRSEGEDVGGWNVLVGVRVWY